MQECECCARTMLVGEMFRMFRRRVGAAVAVCAVCSSAATERGWRVERGIVMRQMHVRPRRVVPLRVSLDAYEFIPRGAGARVPASV